jgi:Ni/Co efflux regulator RcnB
MKRILITALAATTALTGVVSAGAASAQSGYGGYQRDHDRDRDRDGAYYRGRDRDRDGVPDRVERWQRRDWQRDHERWRRGEVRYYGDRYGYNGYHGHWRSGQRYPYWRNDRYVINDWRAYRLPPPRPGYRYYRDDSGDIVMVAIASGLIGMIVGSAIND